MLKYIARVFFIAQFCGESRHICILSIAIAIFSRIIVSGATEFEKPDFARGVTLRIYAIICITLYLRRHESRAASISIVFFTTPS